MSADVPDGFVLLKLNYGFLQNAGPLYGKFDGGKFSLGFRVEIRHCNPHKICHGGMLATFADMFLPMTALLESGGHTNFVPTVSLHCDFLAMAPLGCWVESRAEMLKMTKNLLFAQGVATADGVPVLRANGIFKSTAGKLDATKQLSMRALLDMKDEDVGG